MIFNAYKYLFALCLTILSQQSFSFNININFISGNVNTDYYKIKIYTTKDIGIFSYFDSTFVHISDEFNAPIDSAEMTADTIFIISPGQGFYWVEANKPLSILVGDSFTRGMSGYFAIDENGKPISRKLNTWMMMNNYTQGDFIVFGYSDNTVFTVKNLITKNIIRTDTLNCGEHYSFKENGGVPFSTALQVTASAPISALSYTDQDYYVPSANGSFAGTVFYGFSAYNGNWTNSITVTSYYDSNYVAITNSVTGDTINSYWASAGQVHSDSIKLRTFWKVESMFPVTAANIPFVGITVSYAFMTRAYDGEGSGFANLFYTPTVQINTWVTSLEDSNTVIITQLGKYFEFPYTNQLPVWNGYLNKGEVRGFTSNFGPYVFKIEGTKKMHVLHSSGGYGADFFSIVFPSEPTQVFQENFFIEDYQLFQNYPNPFNSSTKIKYSIPQTSQVLIKVFDVLGKEIETLINEEKPAGTYESAWNAANLPSGVYFYQLKAGEYVNTKKMILLK